MSPKSKATRRADPRPPQIEAVSPIGDTAAERREWGRSLRKAAPRSALAHWTPAPDRPDSVALLLEQSAARVPELVPIRHARMLESSFAFYRGAALIMAADLARAPTSRLFVQACGDAHLSNFGFFATPERQLAFDINDFDETHPAPFEWDLLRLAASLVIAADTIGLSREVGRLVALAAAMRYREQIRDLAGRYFLDVWYSKVDVQGRREIMRESYTKSELRLARKTADKTRRKTNVGSLDRLAEKVDGEWRIREEPPLIVRADKTERNRKILQQVVEQYLTTVPGDMLPVFRHYRRVDFARKVVGVGSVGTQAHIALLIGLNGDDPLFLQLKEADDSVLEPYTVGGLFKHQGERVVFGQRLLQASNDAFLGWSHVTSGRRRMDFYVRQLADWKGSADVARMDERRLLAYADACAEALARGHARSGSANAIGGYIGKGEAFDQAVASFAAAYADQNEHDFEAFAAAAAEGRVPVAKAY